MRIEELDSVDLLAFDRHSGVIRFADERAIVVDSTAMGTLRKELVEHLGAAVARVVLTRLGHVQGWRLAEALKRQGAFEAGTDWQTAGGRAFMLEGMYGLTGSHHSPLSPEGTTITGSFEAEQHIAHLGRSDDSTCWMICGLLSGYLSQISGQEIFVLEDRCAGKGDTDCHLLGRTRAGWGDTRADELRFFHSAHLRGGLDASLHQVTTTLEAVEARLRDARRAIVELTRAHDISHGMVARSPPMRRLLDLTLRVARVDSTVLISGESGTGKERIARILHDESSRAGGPFLAVNCGALTETLLDSELFGHARGAFTGAVKDRPGLLEAAGGGTLLLDEVGEMTSGLQVKLLRVLQERQIRRVGENQARPIDVRVIAATHRDLTQRMADGLFRADLYYRLNVVELHVPALRERRDDILPLARALLAEAALRLERPIAGLSPPVADQLLRYDWPGNVRELANAMERVVVLGRGGVTALEDLPEEVRAALPAPIPSGAVQPLAEVEKAYIVAVLARNGGNQTQTAEQLGIGTATLYRKLKAYGMTRTRGARGRSRK